MSAARQLIMGAVVALGLCSPALALRPPEPGMLKRMEAAGTLENAKEFAHDLGTWQLRMPRLGGTPAAGTDPQLTADAIAVHLGATLTAPDGTRAGSSTQSELDWAGLDLNRDQVVDERDVLALGFQAPKETAAFPSLGTVKTFALLIDFPNYPHYFDAGHVGTQMFGDGDGSSHYGSMHHFYDRSSFGALNVTGEVYGWHTASKERSYYHPDDSLGYPEQGPRQTEMVQEAILAADAAGADFSQYDNDGDGAVDYFLVVWSGPNGDWSTFWWGYFGVALPWDFVVDGVHFSSYSWQAERWYYFGSEPPLPPGWDPGTVIHETGHSLGLPDFYDYDGNVGPSGGLGGFDQMDGGGDHGCFNKYWLGWLAPTVAFTNLSDERLDKAGENPDAVLCMPGFDPVAPWAEYFMAQYRPNEGFDMYYPASGMLLWHVDSRVDNYGGTLYNNSYSDHKLIQVIQADGLDEIELGLQGADAEDYYVPGFALTPGTYPNSNRHDGSATGVSVTDIQSADGFMTADFVLYTSAPPNVTISAPTAGTEVTGTIPVTVDANDDGGVARLQLLIDGEAVAETTSSALVYDWNTLVDFNKTLTLTARAWDAEGACGSHTISVTVNNAGLTSYTDDFEAGLADWRVVNPPGVSRGQFTTWDTRASPGDPVPPGGSEAWVRPHTSDEWHGCWEYLRGQRLDTSAFANPTHLRFWYRARGGLRLEYSADEGATWVRAGDVPSTYGWRKYNRLIQLPQGAVYLRLVYSGDVREDDGAGWGANIDDLLIEESASGAPTVAITSHTDGDVITGDVTFAADAADDGSIAQVEWFVMDGPVMTDTDGAPYEYSRNSNDDDNHPAVRIAVVAEDNDGLPSEPAQVTVVWKNPRNFPTFDDLEGANDEWGPQNDGTQPQWQFTGTNFTSGSQSIALVGGWEAGAYDGLWYSGPPVAAGRRCIDLSGDLVTTPRLSFDHLADMPDDGSLAVYFFTTWGGFQDVAWYSGDTAGWVREEISLERFIGQSGVFAFWLFGGSATNGTGIWIDDVRVDNMPPRLDSVSSGNLLPGDPVVLNGTGFGATRGTSMVTFADGQVVQPANYLAWSNNSITARIPADAVSGDVFVTVQDQQSNSLPLTVSAFQVTLAGLDPATWYVPADTPLLLTSGPAGVEEVELFVDGVSVDSSTVTPFNDLAIDFGSLVNGLHSAHIVAQRLGVTAQSDPLPFGVFSLAGDVDLNGLLDGRDVNALRPLVPMEPANPAWVPWLDTTGDALLREDDAGWIGYHFGQTL